MGCVSSKVDDLPAVALCRERCGFLDEAIKLRFALAEAHLGYIHSLKSIGPSLHHFINQNQHGSVGFSDSPPPEKEKKHLKGGGGGGGGGTSIPTEQKKIHSHSKSNSGSGSHLQFNSDSEVDGDDDDEDSGSHLHLSDHSSPMHHQHHNHDIDEGQGGHFGYDNMNYGSYSTNQEMLGSYPGGGFMNMNYMKKKGTTSKVVYEQRPKSPQRVYMGESSSSYNPYPYPTNNSYPYGYPNYGGGGGGGGGVVTGYYGSFPPQYGSNPPPPAEASTSKPPPPPPSPPRASAWDYLNLFESNDKYYPTYTPSRDSKELREEEGIPDLEEEDYQHEVVKEVHGNQKFVDGNYSPSSLEEEDSKSSGASSSGGGGNANGGGDEASATASASLYQTRPSVETGGMEYEVHVVEKKVVDNEGPDGRSNAAAARSKGPLDALEVAKEIEVQFVRASESGQEIAQMLEVGKRPYRPKHVSSKMLHVVTPPSSLVTTGPSTSKSDQPSSSSSTDKPGANISEFEEEVVMRSGNLSSTLHKLHLWEKKLYNEVKDEEKMRVLHDRKVRKLKRLDEKGAEAHKIDATRTIIRSLSTKIRMAIQVVDKISVTINKIRDEELWPQLNELIQGLARMWKCMLECHHNQCQAIRDARGLGYNAKKTSDAHLEATLQLERELLNWTLKFSSWVVTQKGVRALNNWLMRCLFYEPEETPDGIVPFSPGRIGAPPVFVICHQWSQALERISEKEVVNSLRTFAMSILHLWEQDKLEMRERMVANKDLERKVKSLDKEDQKIQKEIHALDKKVIMASDNNKSLSEAGHIVYQSDTSSKSLQGSLQHIFEAMERFTADSMKAYKELMQRTEEETLRQTQETTT